MKSLILFDFDGTVIDNSEGIFNCIRYALDKAGTPCPDNGTLRRFVGPSLSYSYCRYIKDDPEAAERFVADYRERYAPVGHAECRLYPGITETLEKLNADGFICAVCSGKPYAFVEKIVKLLGIERLFSGLFCPGFSNRSSDKTGLILEAAERFGVKKEDVLMIGDTVFDIRAAKEAGVESMGVTYGFSEPGELHKAGAEYIALSPAMIYNEITSVRPCVIFGAGEYATEPPELPENAFVIAADGGYKKCLEWDITPDLLIGDFDSLGAVPGFNGATVRLPAEKDVTDTDAAVSEALRAGCKSFLFYGCTGGRPDHTIANIALLKRLSSRGIMARLYGKGHIYTAVTDGALALGAENSGYISVFSLSEKSFGVYEKGLKYSLDNAVLSSDFALGVSNEFTGSPVYISVQNGTLLCVYEKKQIFS